MKKLVILLTIILIVSIGLNVAQYLKKDVGYVLSNAISIGCYVDNGRNQRVCTVLANDNKVFDFKYALPPKGTTYIAVDSFVEKPL